MGSAPCNEPMVSTHVVVDLRVRPPRRLAHLRTTAGRLLASHGAERDQQLILWSPASHKQLGRARLKEPFDAVAFCSSDDKLACINRDSLVGAGLPGLVGWWMLVPPASCRPCLL